MDDHAIDATMSPPELNELDVDNTVVDVESSGGLVGEAMKQAREPQGDAEARLLRARVLGRVMTELGDDNAPVPRIDRFIILERLGSGGAGVVYAAYDPKLERKVALKLLRPTSTGHDESEGRARLLREARAMARLTHPNVLAVHDVGTVAREVYLVLELVDGEPLDAWLRGDRRPWKEVRDVFVQAARGLAAAHRAGLVHRDFKPHNVLIDRAGRVRVMDFGLATPPRTEDNITESDADIDDTGNPFATRPGTVMGTPAYMSPEQHLGQPVEPASDQFAFCVALYEGLYGESPFERTSTSALRRSVVAGAVKQPPTNRDAPAFIRRALLRGLSVEPTDRFGSMEDLIQELTRDQRGRWRKTVAAVGVMAVALAGGAFYGQREGARSGVCGLDVGDVWSAQDRRALENLLAEPGASTTALTRVLATLDQYAGEWTQAHDRACENLREGSTERAAAAHRTLACLEGRLREMEGVVELLEDRGVSAYAVDVAGSLEPLDRCQPTPAEAAETVALQPQQRAQIAALRGRLARVKGLEVAGKYDDAVQVAETAVEEAREQPGKTLLAESLYRLGSALDRQGEYREAEKVLIEASQEAEARGQDEISARARTELVVVVGDHLARFEDGHLWGGLAAATIQRMGNPEDLEGELLANLGAVDDTHGRHTDALRRHTRALELRERHHGPRHPLVALSHKQIGNVHYGEHAWELAADHYKKALDIRVEVFGPDHPLVATIHNNLGIVAAVKDQYEEARIHHEEAFRIWRDTLGLDHPQLALSFTNLGIVAMGTGRWEEAVEKYERGLALRIRHQGPDHVVVAGIHENLANAYAALGRDEEAKANFERAKEIWRTRSGAENPEAAVAASAYGSWFESKGDLVSALERYNHALAVRRRTLGDDHFLVGASLQAVGRMERALGNTMDAMQAFRDAMARVPAGHPDPVPNPAALERELGLCDVARGQVGAGLARIERARRDHERLNGATNDMESVWTDFELGKLFWQRGSNEDRTRARRLIEEAHGRTPGEDSLRRLQKQTLDTWLRAHSEPPGVENTQ